MRSNGEQVSQVPPLISVEQAGIKISEFQKERGVRYVPSAGIKNEVLGPSSGKSYKQQLHGIFKQSFEKWRGSKPHKSLPLENGFILFDHYPDVPLAPIQFLTPI